MFDLERLQKQSGIIGTSLGSSGIRNDNANLAG